MTQRTMNELERDFNQNSSAGVDIGSGTNGESISELLHQVRYHSVKFLSEVSRSPRSLRVRAGEVSFDIEWSDQGQPAEAAADPGASHAADAVAEQASAEDHLTAPTVGVYYEAPEPGAAPFVNEGDLVEAGQQVAIIEAMKLMIPVEADRSGRITGTLKKNGESVEYGEPLFTLGPAETD